MGLGLEMAQFDAEIPTGGLAGGWSLGLRNLRLSSTALILSLVMLSSYSGLPDVQSFIADTHYYVAR
jgi:hypothetical protein